MCHGARVAFLRLCRRKYAVAKGSENSPVAKGSDLPHARAVWKANSAIQGASFDFTMSDFAVFKAFLSNGFPRHQNKCKNKMNCGLWSCLSLTFTPIAGIFGASSKQRNLRKAYYIFTHFAFGGSSFVLQFVLAFLGMLIASLLCVTECAVLFTSPRTKYVIVVRIHSLRAVWMAKTTFCEVTLGWVMSDFACCQVNCSSKVNYQAGWRRVKA